MSIYVTGDKHGKPEKYYSAINQIDCPSANDVIIVCGDAGLEYGTFHSKKCKRVMSAFEGDWLVLRGNHDTRYWRDHPNWLVSSKYGAPTAYQPSFPNIHYILDEGGLYTIQDMNFLMVPGAYSVDKDYRLSRELPYESEEQLTETEQIQLCKIACDNLDDIDYVCGHTFPMHQQTNLQYLFMECIDQSTVDKSMEFFLEELMGEVEKGKRFKQYFGGHYHDDKKLDENYCLLMDFVVEVTED